MILMIPVFVNEAQLSVRQKYPTDQWSDLTSPHLQTIHTFKPSQAKKTQVYTGPESVWREHASSPREWVLF